MPETTSAENISPQPLTLEQRSAQPLMPDMIEPIPDNGIPPDGFFTSNDSKDPSLEKLYRELSKRPNDPEARLELLEIISRKGNPALMMLYLLTTDLPGWKELKDEARVREYKHFADFWRNAAVAAQKRNEWWRKRGVTPPEDPSKYLENSKLYLERARKLEEELKQSQQK